MNFKTSKLSFLLGSASLLTLAGSGASVAQVQEVLITGSVITGSAPVGVPVTSIGAEDFRDIGALTVADVIRTLPSIEMANFDTGASGGRTGERGARVDFRTRDVGGDRGMFMVDTLRYPGQYIGGNVIDPSIIPEIAIDRVEVLADGASSLYGSDAVAGVINIILRRGFDGAITQARFGTAVSEFGGGMNRYQFGQLYGKTWESGSVMLAYEFNEQDALNTTDERLNFQFTEDFTPWGLDNRTNIASSRPATVTVGAPVTADPILGAASCTNCFAIPTGTGWDFGAQNPGPTISWDGLMQNPGTNLVNPYSRADLTARTQRNAVVLTFDQRILDQEIFGGVVRGATLIGHAFYNNRRTVYFRPATQGNVSDTFRPPTSNPYYPDGAPEGLRVHYSLVDELNPRLVPFEIAARWSTEIEVEFLADWLGRFNYSVSDNQTGFNMEHQPNPNMVDAALGLTVPAQAATESLPEQGAFTKPDNVPFLNVFCDATTFQCNSPATLRYISGYARGQATHQLHEWNAQFDGPIFMLPGGEVRAAIGAQLRSWNYNANDVDTTGTHSTSVEDSAPSVFTQQIPATYVQLNVPVFSDMNAIPLLQRLELEASYRYDHYYDAGAIYSPKISGEYSPGFGLTFRASWGESFRAPAADDLTAASAMIRGLNVLGDAGSNTLRACPVGSATPVPGTAGERLVNLGLASCDGVGAPLFPGGFEANGAAWPGLVGLYRPEFGTGPQALQPETATNQIYGVVFEPEISFLAGLRLEANYWRIQIDDILEEVNSPRDVNLLKTDFNEFIITPDNPGGDYFAMVESILASPTTTPNVNASDIVFVIDGARRNHGRHVVEGIDFNASYDYEAGNLGLFSFGLSGSYFLTEKSSAPGFNTVFNTNRDLNSVDFGVSTIPRLKWRGTVGWTDGTFSAVAIVNHTGHFHVDQVLTNATAQFPDWTNMLPAHTTLDLSLAYNTGTTPANSYLHNINLQLTVNDVLDHAAPFAYVSGGRGVSPAAFWGERGGGYSPIGRYATFYVTKEW